MTATGWKLVEAELLLAANTRGLVEIVPTEVLELVTGTLIDVSPGFSSTGI